MSALPKLDAPSGGGLTLIGSPLSSIASNTLYAQAHGLGYTPSDVVVVATCTTTDNGHAVGEKKLFGQCADRDAGSPVYGLDISVDSTNIYMRTGPNGLPVILNPSTGAISLITGSSWSWQFAVRGSN